jgi:cysteine synthase A
LFGFLTLYALGTGGTIAGIGQFFKSKNEEVQVVLADPEGSGLYNKVEACLI